VRAAPPAIAAPLVDRVADELRRLGLAVAEGQFGAEMAVELINDGPVTIWLDTAELRS
jgi:D-tyrosyl-tRNA(Tyr) deacylase